VVEGDGVDDQLHAALELVQVGHDDQRVEGVNQGQRKAVRKRSKKFNFFSDKKLQEIIRFEHDMTQMSETFEKV
jgi:hypothetical protein